MSNIAKKNFNSADETLSPGEKLKVEVVTLEDIKIQQVTAQPGWVWSKHLKPIVKTESCQKHHLIYIISGRLASRMDDGKEEEFGPGDIAVIPPGHDGWTIGDEAVVWLEIPH